MADGGKDVATPSVDPDFVADEVPETGGPGTLVVKERAVSRVAVAAALTVPAVVRQVGGMSKLTGRELPRADVSVGEHSVSVNLYVALAWPCRIADAGAAIAEKVGRALNDIIGLPLHQLNVLVVGTSPAGSPEPSAPSDAAAFRPRPPTASPAAVPVALVLSLVLLGVAFVAGREFLIAHDTIDGSPWIANAVNWIAELHWQPWMIGAAAACVVVGAILVVLGLKPRTKTHTGAGSKASQYPMVWLRPTDVARICSDHAGSVPGVDSARTTVTPKRVTVDVHRAAGGTNGSTAAVESVRAAVEPTIALLADTRTVRVRVKESKA
ncbi:MAG: DUF6286 domain-containing protein [Rhodococcus fascians]